MTQFNFLTTARWLFRTFFYLLTLLLLALLGKGGLSLIQSMQIPFGMSDMAVYLLCSLFFGLFLCLGLLLVLHFIKPSAR